MSLHPRTTTGATVLELLEHVGPMSAREIADFMGRRVQDINSAITCIRRAERRGEPRRLFVKDWHFPTRAGHGRESAIWAAGAKPDKPKPPRDRRAAWARYDVKRRTLKRVVRAIEPGNPFGVLIAQVTK